MLRPGCDVTLASYGPLAGELLDAAEELAAQGIRAQVVLLHRIAPLDPAPVLDAARETGHLLVLEDCVENGSVGQQLAAAAAERGLGLKSVTLLNLKNSFLGQGSVAQLRRQAGLDAAGVVRAVKEVLHG